MGDSRCTLTSYYKLTHRHFCISKSVSLSPNLGQAFKRCGAPCFDKRASFRSQRPFHFLEFLMFLVYLNTFWLFFRMTFFAMQRGAFGHLRFSVLLLVVDEHFASAKTGN